MRWAFSISGQRDSQSAIRAAQLAEDAGCRDVWITEDYCERGAFALAGAIAAVTSRVRVGIGVVNPWTRHPAVLAMELATLEELSAGRAVLGLGASNERWMTEQLGIPFDRPIARLAECVDVVRAFMTGHPVDHVGENFRIAARLSFIPPRASPPIILGVKGPRALAMATARADGLLLSMLASPPYLAEVRRQVGPDLELSAYLGLSVDPRADVARQRLRPIVATFLGVHGDHAITRAVGLSPQRCALFRDGWRAGTPRTDLVDDDLIEALTVSGTPGDAATAWRRFAAAGLDVAVVRDDPTTDPERTLTSAAEIADLAQLP